MDENLVLGVRVFLATIAPHVSNEPARRATEKVGDLLDGVARETMDPEDATEVIAALCKVLQ